ncbi:MAG TPA: phage holin family protein [Acidimicrobiales bacterium]
MANTAKQDGEDDFADALHDFETQARNLVRKEVDVARRELLERIKPSAPGVGLIAAAAVCSVFCGAASYRLTLRILERWLNPGTAAFLAAVGYGSAGARMALIGIRALQEAHPARSDER